MPIYRGPGGSSPLNDNVAVDDVAELTIRAEDAAEAAQGSAAEAFQNAEAANQSKISTDQQRAFAQAAAQEASGYAVEAFESKQLAQQQAATATTRATQAREFAEQAEAAAASVDAENLARVDQPNTFVGSQTISKDSGDVGLTIVADPDNDVEDDNAFLELSQDGGSTKGGVALNSANSTVLSSFKAGGSVPFNSILFRQDNLDTQNKSMVIDATGRVGINTTNATARLTVRGDVEAYVDPESDVSVERLASFVARPTTGRTQSQASIVSPESNVVAITSGENDTLKLGTNSPNDNSTFNEVMRLTPQGDVSIGTTEQPAVLTVLGEIINDKIARTDQSNTFNDTIKITKAAGDVGLIIAADPSNTDESDNPFIAFQQDGANTQARFRLSQNGNALLISTINPFSPSFNKMFFQQENNQGVIRNSMMIDDANNVGIGTENPTSKLHVNGDLTVAGDIINSGLPTQEAGTWTPFLRDLGDNEVGTGAVVRNGEYVKDGKVVTVWFRYQASSSAAANLTIGRLVGLPFPIKDTTFNGAIGNLQSQNIQFDFEEPHIQGVNNTSLADLRCNRSGSSPVLPRTPNNGGAFQLQGALTYETN